MPSIYILKVDFLPEQPMQYLTIIKVFPKKPLKRQLQPQPAVVCMKKQVNFTNKWKCFKNHQTVIVEAMHLKRQLNQLRNPSQELWFNQKKNGENGLFLKNRPKMQLIILLRLANFKRQLKLQFSQDNGLKLFNCYSIKLRKLLDLSISKLLNIILI